MKYLALFIVLSIISCHRPDNHYAPQPVYKGVVISSICGFITVQFTDGTKMGQADWTNDVNDSVYHYVFRVSNPCNWKSSTVTSREFMFRMVPPSVQDCPNCLAAGPVPDTAYYIEVVK